MQPDPVLFEEIRGIVAEVLCVEREEAQLEALLFADLDADSLSLLELSFRLEKQYGTRIRFQDLFTDEIRFDATGRLMPESLALLAVRYPFLNLPMSSADDRPVRNIAELLTVASIAGFVQSVLGKKSTKVTYDPTGPVAAQDS